jgi:hypothetical protein
VQREPKPFWREVPQELKEDIANVLGAPVRRAVRIFGGFGPSATFRLFLADGRTAFAKGAGVRATEHHWNVLPREEHAYRDVRAIRAWAPTYFGSVRCAGWHLLLLEDLRGVAWVPPWTEDLAFRAIHDVAAFHTSGLSEPADLPRLGDAFAENWTSVARGGEDRDGLLHLFGDQAPAAEVWLDASLPVLRAAEGDLMRPDQPWGLLHSDIRSDNLAFRQGRLVLFDWADICHGPIVFDIAAFLPSVESEGGPRALHLVEGYIKALAEQGVTMPAWAFPSAASAVAGYFASRAGRTPLPGLPRLRSIQSAQLRFALPLAAAALGLPQPPQLHCK